MEIPAPPPCPPRLRSWLAAIQAVIQTNQPVAGKGITVDQYQGKGSIIGTMTVPGPGAIDGGGGGGGGLPTPPGGFVILGANGGTVSWYSTQSCQCAGNTIDGGGA